MSGLAAYERKEARKVLVVVVDGSTTQRRQVEAALGSFYRVIAFDDGDRAVSEMIRTPPCVILVDETAPPSGGATMVSRLRKASMLAKVPIIFTTSANRVTLADEVRQMGAEAFLTKPYRRSSLIRSISGLVNRSTEAKWEKLAPEPQKCLRQTVDLYNGISDMIDKGAPIAYGEVKDACEPLVNVVRSGDYKAMLTGVRDHDNYSYVHSLRVATLLSLFGHTVGLDDEQLMILATGGLMHDIGKMQIAHEVLNKPGALDEAELALMRSHVACSVEYLERCLTLPKGVAIIASQHHEKLDGSGYPNGLKGAELNRLARMASIVDVFGALTDRRIYKPPMAPEAALGVMTGQMAAHLDQALLGQFRAMLLDAATPS